jgi:hypothetical protein
MKRHIDIDHTTTTMAEHFDPDLSSADPIFASALDLLRTESTIEDNLARYRLDVHARYRRYCIEAASRVDLTKPDPFLGQQVSANGKHVQLARFIAEQILVPCLKSGSLLTPHFVTGYFDLLANRFIEGEEHGERRDYHASSGIYETRAVHPYESKRMKELMDVVGLLIGYFDRPLFHRCTVEIGVHRNDGSTAFYKVQDLRAIMSAEELHSWPKDLSLTVCAPIEASEYLNVFNTRVRIRVGF